MPVRKTGKSGYQYGKSGKVYHGEHAKEKAEKQAKAIHASGYKEKSSKSK